MHEHVLDAGRHEVGVQVVDRQIVDPVHLLA
jgi:hypothetical protein